jgi:hypothetical protein
LLSGGSKKATLPSKWQMARRLLKLSKDAKALKQLSAEKQEKKMKAKKK